MRSFVNLLLAQAPRESYERLVREAEEAGDSNAAHLRADLGKALQLRDTLERQRKREAELSGLYATANDLTSIRDLDHILLAIVRRARQLLGTDIAYLALNDHDAEVSRILVTDGSVSDSFANLRMAFGTGLLGLVAQTGQPYSTSDYQADERFQHRGYIDEAVADESIRAILGVPMLVDGECIGALLASNRTTRPFPAQEVQLLGSFAAHAAIALENARLFEQVADANERLRERTADAEAAADMHDNLMAVLLRGGDQADVARVLAASLGAGVTIADPDGDVLYPTIDAAAAPVPAAVAREALETGRSIVVEGSTPSWVATASAGGEHLATIVVTRETPLSAADRRSLERTAVVVAMLGLLVRTAVEAEERVRADLLDDLLNGSIDDLTRVRERARRQEVGIDRPTAVFAIGSEAADQRRASETLSRIATESGGLSGFRAGALVLAVPTDQPIASAQRVSDRLRRAGICSTIGVAGPVESPPAWARAFREARQCLHTLVALGRVGDVADDRHIGFARLLLGDSGEAEAEEFVTGTIGPLLDYDARRGTELARTLDCWFDNGGSAVAVGRAMHLHANTVTQRLERIASLIGSQWRDPARSLDVRLALRIHRLRDM
ncbi:MAG: helix-turn-helix domain-containing protein [Nocardioidaceae bacterium]